VSAVSACQSGGVPVSEVPPTVIAPGSVSREDEAEARRLLASAEVSFEARRFPEALRTVATVIDSFPASSVSGDALLLSARAALELGDLERADAAAGTYAELVAGTDSRATAARLVQARAQRGNPSAQLDRLLRIEVVTDSAHAYSAVALARAAADSLSPAELETVLQIAPADAVVVPILEVRHAVTLLERGDSLGATRLAAAAIEAGVPTLERAVDEGVLRGELPAARQRVTAFSIAAVLPQGGPWTHQPSTFTSDGPSPTGRSSK
jgi:hypothetical protein